MNTQNKRVAPWLQEGAEKKREATIRKLTDAMKAIEIDIQANDNLYPFNGGAVTQAEVCRRAGVSKTLLQAPSHKVSTKIMVDKWVADLNERLITGRKNIRRAVTARVDDWKQQHEYLRNSYHIDMLKLEEAEARVRALTAINAKLSSENAALRNQIANPDSNVKALFPKVRKNKNPDF